MSPRTGRDIAGDADPFEPLSCAAAPAPAETYRTAPRYWIPGYPSTGALTLTTSWHQIGLPVSVDVLDLGVSPFSTESGGPPKLGRSSDHHGSPSG
ncbi:hypothetical protein [Rhodococcus sp. 3A]|nr:hypothetical protein [Rhodococcus sp. 3A]ELB86916.1 hypothetical protein Rwratislav_42472 [Rhodococcus wratislaviensis IFP 2016]MBC2637423.1 hypothetical protein [Rhodococcus sp. 3A]MBC2898154.1 hypothetical protein [Rhodococcus sp. 4CII]